MDFALFQQSVDWAQAGALNLDLFKLDLFNDAATSGLSIAQVYKDDLFGNVGRSWDNFIRSGQVWALVVGFVLGYLFRSLSS